MYNIKFSIFLFLFLSEIIFIDVYHIFLWRMHAWSHVFYILLFKITDFNIIYEIEQEKINCYRR